MGDHDGLESVITIGWNAHPNNGTMEFSLRDPDGYYVTIGALNPA